MEIDVGFVCERDNVGVFSAEDGSVWVRIIPDELGQSGRGKSETLAKTGWLSFFIDGVKYGITVALYRPNRQG